MNTPTKISRRFGSLLLLGLVAVAACSKETHYPVKIELTERQRLKGFSAHVADFQVLFTGQLLAQTAEVEKLGTPLLHRLGVFDLAQGWDVALSHVLESREEVRPRVAAFSNPVGTQFVIAREIPLFREGKEIGKDGADKISVERSRLKLEWFDIKTRAVLRTDWEGIVEGRYGDNRLRGIQLRLLPDLSYLALVTLVDGSLNLMRFSPTGKLVYSAPLLKGRKIGVYNWPIAHLAEGTSATVVQLSLLEGNRAPFETLHGVTLPANKGNGAELLMVYGPTGKLTALLPIEEGDSFRPSVSAVQQQRLVVAGERALGDERSEVVVALYDLNEKGDSISKVGSQAFPLTKKQDAVRSLALLPNGRILLSGEAGYRQVKTHSVVEGGEAYLALLDERAQTMLGFTKLGNRARRNNFDFLRLGPGGEIFASAYLDGPLTHSADGGRTDQAFSTSAFYQVKLTP